MSYRLSYLPPPGVAFQQTRDGTLLIHYEASMIAPLRASLEKLREDLLEQAVAEAKAKKDAELKRQQLPVDKLTLLDNELQQLESQRAPAPVSTPVQLIPYTDPTESQTGSGSAQPRGATP